MMKTKITVVGSVNMDLVTEAEVPPKLGETILGSRFSLLSGGKGANQAVAAARLGADVALVACVGEDVFGERALANLRSEGVRTEAVRIVSGETTGTAAITVTNGENSIIVVPGANARLSDADILRAEAVLRESAVVLLQLEIPMAAVLAAARTAKAAGAIVILNPAPYRPLPDELLAAVDFLTPNEHEFEAMRRTGLTKAIAAKTIVTKGKNGAQYCDGAKHVDVPAYSVKAIDTTGAGDVFNAALAVALAEGRPLADAVKFANAAGALSVTKRGAQTSAPYLEDVLRFLENGSL
ncbi:ribokinase [Caenibacillus caldisaponilyticus]|uniref:ribokinase n=1 Tax=Caenibacillus caldisaponilyticus TaxID=1674942 RepID=UPI0009887EC1|nr:ribokinase [Caenibacillus caldisaponilyticus]